VPVRRCDLARQNHLDAGEQRVGRLRLAARRRIFQDQYAALGFLGRDQATRFHHQRFDVGVFPDMRHDPRHGLLRNDRVHHPPERRQITLGDAVVKLLPGGVNVVLGTRSAVGFRFAGGAGHGALLRETGGSLLE